MSKKKLRLWLILVLLGLIGVLSLLASALPMDKLPPEVIERFSPTALKLLMLINPAFLVILFTFLGTLVYDKVNLHVPFFERLAGIERDFPLSGKTIITTGLILGAVAGVLIVVTARIFEPSLPSELLESSQEQDLSVITKLLYGGIAEELLTRFGLMSLVVWALYKLFKKLNRLVYWLGITIAALLFALGHFPMMFQLVEEPTTAVYAYILLGNSVGGLLFGYAYLRSGLESAFIAHATAHLVMIALGSIL